MGIQNVTPTSFLFVMISSVQTASESFLSEEYILSWKKADYHSSVFFLLWGTKLLLQNSEEFQVLVINFGHYFLTCLKFKGKINSVSMKTIGYI